MPHATTLDRTADNLTIAQVPCEAPATGPDPDEKRWTGRLAAYREPNTLRSILELAITAGPFLLISGGALTALMFWQWWALALLIPAAALLVRLFMIQHDCGHGSFFHRRRSNDWVGRLLGVLTLTPYDYWRQTHAIHHASAGNLDQRGMGDVVTLTVAEYQALSRRGRFGYRLYRNPFVAFGFGPALTFIFKHRLPFGLMNSGMRPWLSTMATNLGIALIVGGLIVAFGIVPFAIVYFSISLLAGTVGIWLFWIQHQFEETFWAPKEDWSFHHSALHGSSHYDLPRVLRWFTANIGIHHVHHLASRIPFYRLGQVLRDYPELRGLNRLTLMQSFRMVKLALWDERRNRLISFREAAAPAAA